MAPTPNILSWYDARRPRFIDLVGDYAGKELFLVEGDSLLRHCFEDDRLDFNGKSILHVYMVMYPTHDSFLHQKYPTVVDYSTITCHMTNLERHRGTLHLQFHGRSSKMSTNKSRWLPNASCCLHCGEIFGKSYQASLQLSYRFLRW